MGYTDILYFSNPSYDQTTYQTNWLSCNSYSFMSYEFFSPSGILTLQWSYNGSTVASSEVVSNNANLNYQITPVNNNYLRFSFSSLPELGGPLYLAVYALD